MGEKMKKVVLFFASVFTLISCTSNQAERVDVLSTTHVITSTNAPSDTKTPVPTLAIASVSPTSTATTLPTPIPTETVKEYPLTAIENFKDCIITEEELLDGTYFRWLNEIVAPTLVPIFKARYERGLMQTDVPMTVYTHGATTFIAYVSDASFKDEDTRPFMRNVTFGYSPATWITPEMRDAGAVATGYLVKPIFFYDVNMEIVYPVITLGLANYDNSAVVARTIRIYTEEMNEPIIFSLPTYASGHNDPVVENSYNKFNYSGEDMPSRMTRFMNGDYSALSEEGIVVLGGTLSGEANWFND